jgi:hypothetical protein
VQHLNKNAVNLPDILLREGRKSGFLCRLKLAVLAAQRSWNHICLTRQKQLATTCHKASHYYRISQQQRSGH